MTPPPSAVDRLLALDHLALTDAQHAILVSALDVLDRMRRESSRCERRAAATHPDRDRRALSDYAALLRATAGTVTHEALLRIEALGPLAFHEAPSLGVKS